MAATNRSDEDSLDATGLSRGGSRLLLTASRLRKKLRSVRLHRTRRWHLQKIASDLSLAANGNLPRTSRGHLQEFSHGLGSGWVRMCNVLECRPTLRTRVLLAPSPNTTHPLPRGGTDLIAAQASCDRRWRPAPFQCLAPCSQACRSAHSV